MICHLTDGEIQHILDEKDSANSLKGNISKKTINNLKLFEKCSSSTASTSTEEVNIACANNGTSVSLPQVVSEKDPIHCRRI